MRTVLVMAFVAAVLSACGSSKTVASSTATSTPEQEEARRQQLCGDSKWKEAHLGLWYEVCRTNVMR